MFYSTAANPLRRGQNGGAVPSYAAEESVREFGTMTDDLNALADWLLACGVDIVALELTEVYWIRCTRCLNNKV